MNNFRQMLLKYESFFERHLVLDIQATFRQQKPDCKDFQCKYIENENRKSYLVNKE